MEQKVETLISTVFEAMVFLKNNPGEAAFMLDGLNKALAAVHAQSAFPLPVPPAMISNTDDAENKTDLQIFLESSEKWLVNAKAALNRRPSSYPPPLRYNVDAIFVELINEIKGSSLDCVLRHICDCFSTCGYQKQIQEYFGRFCFWGTMKAETGDFNVLMNRAEALYYHADDFLWFYQRLCDYRSRHTLLAILLNWYSFDIDLLSKCKEQLFGDYFDADIIKCAPDEVLVDLGAFNGDTVFDYVRTYGYNYKRIYCYEISPESVKSLKQNLSVEYKLENIVFREKGVSDKKGFMYIKQNAADSTANTLAEDGEMKIEVVTLDEDITEKTTLIKMDIEGSEQAAIRGGVNHIKNDKPKLAISLYHNNEDIWKIPRMIDEICPGYSFYLRFSGGNLIPTEFALLAVYEDSN